jgi:hypothetical protein
LEALKDNGGDSEKIEQMQHSLYESFSISERGALRVDWTSFASAAVQATLGLAAAGVAGGMLGGLAGGLRKLFGQKESAEGKAGDTSKQIEQTAGILKRETITRTVQHVVSIEQFMVTFRSLMDKLGATRRIYVLIDDLDRCLPDTTLDIFEAIKLFLDAPQCVYIVAVDRAVIRRGLELRYPVRTSADAHMLPPVVDPDEYIEKTVTLSVDLPILSDPDGRTILALTADDKDLSIEEANDIVYVLGTNPRRLKRFGMTLALWRQVAASLQSAERTDKTALAFPPMVNQENRKLFIKLSLIGYLNSALLAEMRRDPGLPGRLQATGNLAFAGRKPKKDAKAIIAHAMAEELPIVAQASLDPTLWRALQLEPSLTLVSGQLLDALRWFRARADDKSS